MSVNKNLNYALRATPQRLATRGSFTLDGVNPPTSHSKKHFLRKTKAKSRDPENKGQNYSELKERIGLLSNRKKVNRKALSSLATLDLQV